MPKPVAIAVKPISKTLQTAAKPTPKSLPIQPKVKPNPSPIQTSRVNLPVNPKPASKTLTPNPIQTPLIDPPIATKSTPKPAQSQPKIKPTTTPVVNPPFTLPTIQPPKTTAIPTPLSSSIATNSLPQTNSPPLPVKPKSIEASMPTNQPVNTPNSTPTTTSDLTPSTEPKSTVRSTPIEQPSGGNSSNPFAAPSQARSPGGIFTGNGSQFNPPDRGNLSPQNSSTPGSGNSDSAEPTLRDRMGNSAPPGNSNPMATSQPTAAGLQCIQHCEIPNLRDLQDRDGGKDRLRIRIVIDPHGLLLAATISKSSDNPQIDAIVLEGIKQMQFKPSGQIIKGIIKANILL
jgi:TonB family protein